MYKNLLKTVFGIAIVLLFTINSCSNAKSEQPANDQKEKISNPEISNLSSSGGTLSTAKADLEKAKKDKKTIFLVVTGNDVKAENIVKNANDASKQVKQSIVLQMNRDDADNVDLVNEFRLSGAPLPIVLVIAKNGLTVGGLIEKEATVQNLVDAVPSVKMLEVTTALSEGKSIFVIAYKKSAKDIKQVNTNCMKACSDVKNATTIELNVEDKTETKLIQQLNIDATQDITTFVINPSGQVTGTHAGIPDANKLVSDAKKVAKSGCCPGGSKSGCK
jgi:hypothetical protein